ncbi:MAG: hypothetical protein JXB18_09025, partial [Sedimentisphaerales bacterium]|nr:hypothetical protein [Sedimentisphaerales bacterium]
MAIRNKVLVFGMMIILAGMCGTLAAQRQTEPFDRGLVAVVAGEGKVYLGWRLLNSDPEDVSFNLYRQTEDAKPIKLNPVPLSRTTDFLDTATPMDKANRWWVCPVIDSKEQTPGGKTALPANAPVKPYITIPLQGKYVCNKVAIADLNGDGQYDYVIKQPRQTSDPGVWQPSTDTWKVEAYLHD